MEDLLNDLSDGDGDESIDFSPPPISSHQAATGFEAEFTETVIIDDDGSNMAQSNRALGVVAKS